MLLKAFVHLTLSFYNHTQLICSVIRRNILNDKID